MLQPMYSNNSSNGYIDAPNPKINPHGNLSLEELIAIKIRKRNVCYVVGLPIDIANDKILQSFEWFGRFGNIATIAINKNSKSIQADSIPAHITYDNNISALNAINFCNNLQFKDGRSLKATFGTQHYCRWFVTESKKCKNVFCGFRHSWCYKKDIVTEKDINHFKSIRAGAYTSNNIKNQPLPHFDTTINKNKSNETALHCLDILTADLYTFYLSNSESSSSSNIYDLESNVLIKHIMSRNHAQQLQIDRLKQEINILSENNKILNEKYKLLLLNLSNGEEIKKFKSWDTDDVIKWIMNLNNNKYVKYENDLITNLKTENIDGQCLESLDKNDLHRLGITDFKDKKNLLNKIKEL